VALSVLVYGSGYVWNYSIIHLIIILALLQVRYFH